MIVTNFSINKFITLLLIISICAAGTARAQTDYEPRPLAAEPHPFTTEPGRVQVEISPFDFTYNRDNNQRIRDYQLPTLLKFGIAENAELKFGFEAFAWQQIRDRDTSQRQRDRGFGDISLGAKINLWGNDQGDTALALNPFVTIPTARHDFGPGGATAGLLVPSFWQLNAAWDIEFTPSLAAVRNDNDDGYVAELAQLAVLTKAFNDELEAFVEFESNITTESGQSWQAAAGTGLTYAISQDTIVELGLSFGLNDAADDANIVLSFIQRF